MLQLRPSAATKINIEKRKKENSLLKKKQKHTFVTVHLEILSWTLFFSALIIIIPFPCTVSSLYTKTKTKTTQPF